MGNIKLLHKAKWEYNFVCYNCKEEKLIEYIAATDSQYLDICGDCKNKILSENGIEITEPTHVINPPEAKQHKTILQSGQSISIDS